jgi:hypothetical protein
LVIFWVIKINEGALHARFCTLQGRQGRAYGEQRAASQCLRHRTKSAISGKIRVVSCENLIMMNSQTELKIKVPLDVAETYWNATDEERQKIEAKIAFYLQSSTLSRQDSLETLYQTMDTIGQKAQERGLTPEILESLLDEDD